jgi:hypothetical protein
MMPQKQHTNPPEERVPTLRALCLEFLDSAIFPPTIEEAMSTAIALRSSELLGLIEELDILHTKCVGYLSERFALLKERYKDEELMDVLGQDTVKKLDEQLKERLKIESRFKDLVGTPLDRKEIDHYKLEGGYYPYASLKYGVAWPDDVDATRREDYLSPADFQEVFGVSRDRFQSFAKHMRVRMKKEKLLF